MFRTPALMLLSPCSSANELAKEGAHVYITGRREPELRTAVQQIGRNATGVRGDVSKAHDLDRLFAQIKDEKGKLDILFANAGIARYATLGNITEELFDSIFNVNVKGVLFTVQKALPLMPHGASVILNASVVGSKGLSSNSGYSATKASIRSFARPGPQISSNAEFELMRSALAPSTRPA